MKVTCHCGNIEISIEPPAQVTQCNCSICSRYNVLWGYYDPDKAAVNIGPGGEDIYSWGDQELEFIRCKECGCVTHYRTVKGSGDPKIAVNFRMAGEAEVSGISVRYFNGKELL